MRTRLAMLVGGLVALSLGCGRSNASSAVSVDTSLASSGTFFPTSNAEADRLAPGEAEAIILLGSTGAGPPAVHEGHSHVDTVAEVPLDPPDAAIFDGQWFAAQLAIPQYDTEVEAAALGYVRAAAPAGGIGTHWVHWSQIAKPFDPALPSMLLFDERKDPPVLVGYSYALQSPTRPEGFAGSNDHWHQHIGLCVNNGWVVREQTAGPDKCQGTYIAGGDFWMLHAWVVQGWDNRKGKFAPFNHKLCPPFAGTPDDMRCPI